MCDLWKCMNLKRLTKFELALTGSISVWIFIRWTHPHGDRRRREGDDSCIDEGGNYEESNWSPDHPPNHRDGPRENDNRDFAFRELFVLDRDDRDYRLSCYNVSWCWSGFFFFKKPYMNQDVASPLPPSGLRSLLAVCVPLMHSHSLACSCKTSRDLSRFPPL